MPQSIFDKMLTPTPLPKMPSRNRLEPEYAEPYQLWKADPSPQNAQALVQSIGPILDTATAPYGAIPNIKIKAKHMAIDAMQNYDPTQASLKTHLMSQLRGLQRYSGQQALPIHVPERTLLQYNDMQRAEAEFRDSEGRDPSDYELSELMNVSPKRIVEIRKWKYPTAEGYVTTPQETDESDFDNAPAVQHTIPAEIYHEFVYSDLSPRDQLIFDYSMGRNGREQLSSKEIAKRIGVTSGLVSQRLAAIQQRINTVQDSGIFGE